MSHSPVTAEEQQQLERILYDYDVFDLRVNIVTVSHPNLREFYKDYFRSLEQIDAFADRLETWLEPGALLRETPKFFTPANTRRALISAATDGRLASLLQREGVSPFFTLSEMEDVIHDKLDNRPLFSDGENSIRARQLFKLGGELNQLLIDSNWQTKGSHLITEKSVRDMHEAYGSATDPVEKMGHLMGIWAKLAKDDEIERDIPKELTESVMRDELRTVPDLLRRFAWGQAVQLLEKTLEQLPETKAPRYAQRQLIRDLTRAVRSLSTKLDVSKASGAGLNAREQIWPPLSEGENGYDPMAGTVFPDTRSPTTTFATAVETRSPALTDLSPER